MTSKLYYVFLSAFLGYSAGKIIPTSSFQFQLSLLITMLVFTTVSPSMLLFRLERSAISFKPLFASFVINFIYSPLYALLILKISNSDYMSVALASLLLMPVPSMNTAYVLLSGGNLSLTVSLMAINFLTGVLAYPFMLSAIAGLHGIKIGINQVLKPLLAVIILPLITGQILSRFLSPSRDKISKATELSLNALVFTIFFSEADYVSIIAFLQQIPLSLGFLASAIFISELISKILKIKKEEHLSYVFLSVGKNNSTVIAILSLALSPVYAVYVMFHQFVQIIVLLVYARMKAENII